MGVREDIGYDDADEQWRREAAKLKRPGVAKVVSELGPIADRVNDNAPAHATSPDGKPVCRRCGHKHELLVSIPGERVTIDGQVLVGVVRTHCAACAGVIAKEMAR